MRIKISGNNQPRLVDDDNRPFYYDFEALEVLADLGASLDEGFDGSDDERASLQKERDALHAEARAMTAKFNRAVKTKLGLSQDVCVRAAHIERLMRRSIGEEWSVEV